MEIICVRRFLCGFSSCRHSVFAEDTAKNVSEKKTELTLIYTLGISNYCPLEIMNIFMKFFSAAHVQNCSRIQCLIKISWNVTIYMHTHHNTAQLTYSNNAAYRNIDCGWFWWVLAVGNHSNVPYVCTTIWYILHIWFYSKKDRFDWWVDGWNGNFDKKMRVGRFFPLKIQFFSLCAIFFH